MFGFLRRLKPRVFASNSCQPERAKERKLRETVDKYQLALHDAFDQNCDTQTKANDVVVDYDVSGYAKNALKQYVPDLLDEDTYDAEELKEDTHPVRFTNEGPQLDHKPQNAIEWYVKIPHHDDYHLWLPAQPPANKRDWLEALHHDDAEMGECQLMLSQRGNPALPMRDEGSDVQSEPRTEQGGEEARTLG